jgi:CRP-like cAMP-binding protein
MSVTSIATVHAEAPCHSHFLSLLPDHEYQAITPLLEPVNVHFKQLIYERGVPIPYIYFPCTCVLSVLAYMQNGAAVEVGTVGNEGFAGIDILLGGEAGTDSCLCQVEGRALRMRTVDFKALIATDTLLRRIAQRYLQAYLSQVSHSVACNRLHTIEERLSRWVLMTHDRVKGDQFHLTQEFLADMLGVHRPSVSLVAGAFQQAGMIRYSRGTMTILDRERMLETSCECYANVAQQFARLMKAEPK